MLTRIARHRLKVILGNWKNVLLLSVLPILLVLVYAQVFQTVLAPSQIPVALVDLDGSEYSRTVLKRVGENLLVSAYITEENTALRQVTAGKKEAAIILAPGFMDNIIAGRMENIVRIARSPSSVSAGLLGEVVAAEVIRLAGNVTAADMVVEHYGHYREINPVDREKIWNEAWAFSDARWELPPLVSLQYRNLGTGQNMKNTETLSIFGGVIEKLLTLFGILTAIIMFLMIVLNGWLVEEKANGIMERLRATNVKPAIYLAGNALAIFAVVLMSTFGVLAVTVTSIPRELVFASPVLLLILAYSVCCLSLALFLAAASASSEQLQAVGILVVLLTSALGGSFFDLGQVTARFAFLAGLTPQGWVLDGIRETLYTPAGLDACWLPLLVLLGSASIFLTLSAKMVFRQ